MCAINEDHMMCGCRYIWHDRQSFLSFWAKFCPWTPKNQNLEKMKETPEDIIILHLHTTNNMMII